MLLSSCYSFIPQFSTSSVSLVSNHSNTSAWASISSSLPEPSLSLLSPDCCSPGLLQTWWPEGSLHHHPSGSGHPLPVLDSLLPGSYFSLPNFILQPHLLHSSPEETKLLKPCLSEMLYSRLTLYLYFVFCLSIELQFGHNGT